MSTDEEDADTAQMESVHWLAPVDRPESLPIEGVPEAALCWVQEDESVWQLRKGAWMQVGRGRDVRADE